MVSLSALFSCYHRSTNIPTPPSSSTASLPPTPPTYPHPCHQCSRLAAQQRQKAIKRRYLRQQEDLATSIAEANKAAIAAKGKEMRGLNECESGWMVMHRVTAAEIEERLGEISRAEGELKDLKTREREEVMEAWKEHDEVWRPLS